MKIYVFLKLLAEGRLNTADLNTLKAASTDKSDIRIIEHDLNTVFHPKT